MRKGVCFYPHYTSERTYRARPYDHNLGTKVSLGYFPTEKAASDAIDDYFKTGKTKTSVKNTKSTPPNRPTEAREFSEDSGTIETNSPRITTLEELLAFTKVDLDVWIVKRHVVNKWEVGAKDPDGNIQVEPLYQVKAWLERKVPKIDDVFLQSTLEQIREYSPKYPRIARPKIAREHLLELCIPDLHMGKLSWAGETGADYDWRIAKQLYVDAVTDLVAQANMFGGIDQILFPIGNDFFQVDNGRNTTTAGTQVDVDSRWPKSFREGTTLLQEVIDTLQTQAPVQVLVIAGNHDRERMFYLGSVLEAWYRNCDNVTVNNEPITRKYFHYGNVTLGFTHGNEEKRTDLPVIMAREAKEWWADTTFAEWHIGHWHTKRSTKYDDDGTEHVDIRIRTIPSLSAPDAWHHKKGYLGSRSAEAFIWHREKGCRVQLSYNIPHCVSAPIV